MAAVTLDLQEEETGSTQGAHSLLRGSTHKQRRGGHVRREQQQRLRDQPPVDVHIMRLAGRQLHAHAQALRLHAASQSHITADMDADGFLQERPVEISETGHLRTKRDDGLGARPRGQNVVDDYGGTTWEGHQSIVLAQLHHVKEQPRPETLQTGSRGEQPAVAEEPLARRRQRRRAAAAP